MGNRAPGKLITWSDRYSVGISRIDAQHQKLVDLINDLHAATVGKEGNSALDKILDSLAGYVVSHFATEEALMKKFEYPGYEHHKAEHEKLSAQVKVLMEKSRGDRTALSPELMMFLQRWLIGHIANLDKKYTAHLNAAGVT
jgi:hemerythrin-like metal-binding protein